MKKLLFIVSCLAVLTRTPAVAQKPAAEVVIVRVEEWNARLRVAIARGGKQEYLEFKMGNTDEAMQRTAANFQKLIQQFYQEGFRLQGTVATGSSNSSTMIFVKE